jgi:large repetitive protein
MQSIKVLRCLLTIGVLAGVSAECYGSGTVAGQIKNRSLQGIANAAVGVSLNNEYVGGAATNSFGSYTITGVPAGTGYKVSITAAGFEYRNVTNVSVSNNQTTNVNATLANEARIIGRTKKANNTAIAEALALAKDVSAGFSGSAITTSTGYFTFDKLPAGTYTVTADKEGYGFINSETVEVEAGETSYCEVEIIGVNGKISGTVTEAGGSVAIEGAYVIARGSNGVLAGFATTDSGGDYELSGLATGSYTVKANRNTGSITKVVNVSVTDGATMTLNLSAAGGSISGTVKNLSQVAITGAILSARKDAGFYTAVSNSSGNYSIVGLAAGTYTVTVDPNENNYVAGKITDVVVVAGQNTSGKNFSLGVDGKISGTVRNASQTPIEGAIVVAVDPANPEASHSSSITNPNGDYTVAHLAGGTYMICVSASGYVSDSEMGVTVTAGQMSSGHDFVLGTSGGTISGTVYRADGQTPIEDAMVQCSSEGKSFGYVMSGSNGSYSLAMLQAGTYQVQAAASGYELEILENIVVTGTQENSGNNFTLDED